MRPSWGSGGGEGGFLGNFGEVVWHFGEVVWLSSLNPYPISDQNILFSSILFEVWPLKFIPIFRSDPLEPIVQIRTKMVEVDTLFQIKAAQKPYPLVLYTYLAYIAPLIVNVFMYKLTTFYG